MSANDGDLVDRLAKKHSVSRAAVQVVLAALRSGGGRMAQFSHADFGGMSQWSPGMSMVGDMFNTQLKAKLDALCTDIAAHLHASPAAGGGSAVKAQRIPSTSARPGTRIAASSSNGKYGSRKGKRAQPGNSATADAANAA